MALEGCAGLKWARIYLKLTWRSANARIVITSINPAGKNFFVFTTRIAKTTINKASKMSAM